MTRLLASCAVVLAVCLSAAAQANRPGEETQTREKIEAPSAVPSSERKTASGSSSLERGERRDEPVEADKARNELLTPTITRAVEEAWGAHATKEFARSSAARKKLSLMEPADELPAKDSATDKKPDIVVEEHEGFHWKQAFEQSLLLLSIQHGYAMTQPKTRRELRGPFFKDYFDSLANLHGWADGGRFFTNYIAHPLQGAATGFIQVQNDPKGMKLQFANTKEYWHSRMKAFAWSAANSTQFELGPLSQAAIGNVGKARKLTYVDLVVTPTLGTTLLISEDILDLYVVRRLEERTNSSFVRVAARMILNPARGCANMLRFKKPWHRDTR